MSEISSSGENRTRRLAWRGFFLAAALLSLGTTILLLQGASEASSRLVMGFSIARLVLIGSALGFVVLFAGLCAAGFVRPAWSERQVARLQLLVQQPGIFGILLIMFSLGLLGGLFWCTLAPELVEPFTAALFNRLLPFAILLTGICALSLVGILALRYGVRHPGFWRENRVFWLVVAFFGLVFGLWAWVVRRTLVGESAITGWNDLGSPVIESQVLIAWLAGIAAWGLIALARRLSKTTRWLQKITPTGLDLGFAILLWVCTVIVWNNIPAPPSHFLSSPRPPNYELYPNSDALGYDLSAQSLLIGQGIRFVNDIYIRRPILALFMAGLHALAGQNYSEIATWQVVFLALLPAFIYLLGSSLGSRLSGVIAGALVMLREANAIALSDAVTVSHAKLLMADLPATLVMVILAYIGVRWLQTRSQLLCLLTGGLLGFAILIRPELGAALLAIALISLLVYRDGSARRQYLKSWLGSMLLLSFGVLLLLAPWVYRNWTLTGQIFLDVPTFRADFLQERYRTLPPAATPTPQSEGEAPGTQIGSTLQFGSTLPLGSTLPHSSSTLQMSTAGRISLSAFQPPLSGRVLPGGSTLPALPVAATPSAAAPPAGTSASSPSEFGLVRFARFVSSHFANSQVQTFLILPTTFRPLDSLVALTGHRDSEKFWEDCCSALSYVRRMPYWHKWYGGIPSQAIVPLIVNLALIALGVQCCWKRNGWIGMLPLAIATGHIILNSLARNSGGRYILPVDWVAILLFSIGLARATVWSVNLFTRQKVSAEVEVVDLPPAQQRHSPQGKHSSPANVLRSPAFYILSLLLLAIGCAAPVLERSIQPRYTDQAKSQMLQGLVASTDLTPELKQSLASLLQEGGTVKAGRALYPRYYKANQGEPGSNNPLGAQPYPRLGFYLLEQVFHPITLPLEERPDAFPNGSDALVIGCPDGQVVAVAVYTLPASDPDFILFRSGEFAPGSSPPPFLCQNPG